MTHLLINLKSPPLPNAQRLFAHTKACGVPISQLDESRTKKRMGRVWTHTGRTDRPWRQMQVFRLTSVILNDMVVKLKSVKSKFFKKIGNV